MLTANKRPSAALGVMESDCRRSILSENVIRNCMSAEHEYYRLGPRAGWVSPEHYAREELYDAMGELWEDVEHMDTYLLPYIREVLLDYFEIGTLPSTANDPAEIFIPPLRRRE